MASEQDVSDYVQRSNVRVTKGMLGGDPGIGTEEREAFRLHRGGSTSYIHSSDLQVAPVSTGRYMQPIAVQQLERAYGKRGE